MMLPDRQFTFPNGLVIPAREVGACVFQYHVLKHPLGISRYARKHSAKDEDPEQWGQLAPPVVERGWRAQLFSSITRIQTAQGRCELPEAHGRKPPRSEETPFDCRACAESVAEACGSVTAHPERPVGLRYRDVALATLESLADGVVLPRAVFHSTLGRHARHMDRLQGLSVLSVGRLPVPPNLLVARFRRSDGVHLEFYVHPQNTAKWRTLYRIPPRGIALFKFLYEQPIQDRSHLSETCVVARRWWEKHGI